jgi:hypothetical protein
LIAATASCGPFSYDIPSFAPSHPRLGEGWQLNGVLTLRSGNPFHLNYNFTGDFNGTGEFFGRPDLIGDPVCRYWWCGPVSKPRCVQNTLHS